MLFTAVWILLCSKQKLNVCECVHVCACETNNSTKWQLHHSNCFSQIHYKQYFYLQTLLSHWSNQITAISTADRLYSLHYLNDQCLQQFQPLKKITVLWGKETCMSVCFMGKYIPLTMHGHLRMIKLISKCTFHNFFHNVNPFSSQTYKSVYTQI